MSQKIGHIALVLALVALALTFYPPKRTVEELQSNSKTETVFERVMQTGAIRCGYFLAPGWVMKEANTGEMSGAIVDYVNAMGKALGLKIVWQEEINLGTYLQDLQNGRYDMECSGGWPNAQRGKQVEYTTPVFYFPLYVAVRANDHRFDNNYAALNDPAIHISGHDGGTNARIRNERFPKATPDDLPGMAQGSNSLLEVANNKADATFEDYATILAFSKNNADKIRIVDGDPVRIVPANLSFALGEYRLQQMLNTATNEMLYDGIIDQIIDKYEPVHGAFLRVVAPYAKPATRDNKNG